MTRAVFLDRDGVLNHAVLRDGRPHPPADAAAMTIVSGAADALLRLRERDFRLIVVTNQPDVARGTQQRDVVEAMNEKLRAALPVDEIVVCWHDGDACDCRKPKPGALLAAARRHGIDLSQSFMIGDRWRDIEAGQRAGVTCLFIDHGYRERQPEGAFVRVDSITGATEEILRMSDQPKVPRPAERGEGGALAPGEGRSLQDGAPHPPLRGTFSPRGGEKDLSVDSLQVKIFADGADRAGMLEMYGRAYIKGFTTNPTLMHKAGLTDYRAFAHSILEVIRDRPISFEVFSDEVEEMERQAREIARWGDNVYVKVPITNTRRESTVDLVRRLSHDGVKVNVTAMMTLEQVRAVCAAVKDGAPSNVSVFAGRIADTGRDPVPLMAEAVEILREAPGAELIWASPRELLNIFQADAIGCHIITVTNDILKKLALVGKDLDDYSLDTVKMFFEDGKKAGFSL